MLLNDMHEDWDAQDNDTRDPIVTLHTAGTGYWSRSEKAVGVTEFVLDYEDEEHTLGELCVHFNTTTWRPDQDGLIYTDPLFLRELREYFVARGFTKEEAADVYYSEQGMQGDNYVSCDVGKTFLTAWKRVMS